MWLDLFTDPILRAPMIGSLLMCLSAALVGVIVFVQKRSLLGEALSHATYPGVTGAIILSGLFSFSHYLPLFILLGAGFSALVALFLIDLMEKKLKASSDSALCFVLAFFFGIGVTLASYAQNTFTALFRQMQGYLFGQAATMTDLHILIYGIFSALIIISISLFYKEILALSFDRSFAKASGMRARFIHTLFIFLLVTAIVIGIRSVGVILISAMLIAPAAAARQFTDHLSRMFLLSALFGALSAVLGVYLSVVIPGMPTGPMIVLVAGGIAFYALLFAPKRGLLIRWGRIAHFRTLQMQENLLKSLWHLSKQGEQVLSFATIAQKQSFRTGRLALLLLNLRLRGWIKKGANHYSLTLTGIKRGGQIVRLHRLWEVYLVNTLGLGVERVHKSAEEMEHILTPELEERLTQLLDDPKHDPHHQPIPARSEVMTHHG